MFTLDEAYIQHTSLYKLSFVRNRVTYKFQLFARVTLRSREDGRYKWHMEREATDNSLKALLEFHFMTRLYHEHVYIKVCFFLVIRIDVAF